jgi:intracellular septation protein A
MLNIQLLAGIVIIAGLILGYISTAGAKTQGIRLVDVFLIGPLMIYIASDNIAKMDGNMLNWGMDGVLNIVLMFFGATTITYNLHNYLAAK